MKVRGILRGEYFHGGTGRFQEYEKVCRSIVCLKGGLCEIRKREGNCSYLAFHKSAWHMTVCGGMVCGTR